MWALLSGAVRYLFSILFGGVVLKAIGFTILAAILAVLWNYALDLVGGAVDLGSTSSGLASLPEDFLYYLVLLRLDIGLPMIIAAHIVRFTIRRLPIIG